MSQRFYANYIIETSIDVYKAAEEMAGEQSTVASIHVRAATVELQREFGARVEAVELLEEVSAPSLPVPYRLTAPIRRARVTLSWPIHNIGTSLPMLYTTLLGNQMGMRSLSGIRLQTLQLPQMFIAQSLRPAFGIKGTRKLCGVYDRPLTGTIVKPNIGLTPAQTAFAVQNLIDGGVDFIKDDELLSNPPYSPIEQRVTSVMRVINDAADRDGKKVMYAFNITDDIDAMFRHHDLIAESGGTCIMVNLNSIGIAGLAALRRHSVLPIHGHRAGWAMLTRCPMLGMDFQPYQLLHRLAGIDHLHVSGLGGKFWEEPDTVLQSARDCMTQMNLDPLAHDDRAMPVFSGGFTVLDADPTYSGMKTTDLIFTSGSGMFSHPDGLSSGCTSLRQAWEAAVAGLSLDAYSKSRPELAAAITQANHYRVSR